MHLLHQKFFMSVTFPVRHIQRHLFCRPREKQTMLECRLGQGLAPRLAEHKWRHVKLEAGIHHFFHLCWIHSSLYCCTVFHGISIFVSAWELSRYKNKGGINGRCVLQTHFANSIFSILHTVVRFVWVCTKFGTCTVVSVNGTLVEDKMRRFKDECEHFSFNKCPISTHDGASAKFSIKSHVTDNSAGAGPLFVYLCGLT